MPAAFRANHAGRTKRNAGGSTGGTVAYDPQRDRYRDHDVFSPEGFRSFLLYFPLALVLGRRYALHAAEAIESFVRWLRHGPQAPGA